jgi:hypothetical protein
MPAESRQEKLVILGSIAWREMAVVWRTAEVSPRK